LLSRSRQNKKKKNLHTQLASAFEDAALLFFFLAPMASLLLRLPRVCLSLFLADTADGIYRVECRLLLLLQKRVRQLINFSFCFFPGQSFALVSLTPWNNFVETESKPSFFLNF
jgi:hypothetical protein